MPRITSLDELNRLRVERVIRHNEEASRGVVHVAVGMGTCGIAAGALEVFRVLKDEIKAHGLKDVVLIETGCIGLCRHEPIVEVTSGNAAKVSYGRVTPELASRIVQEHILEGKPVEEFVIDATPFPTI
jgi:NADP-reducing hydrogenase subunit HndB